MTIVTDHLDNAGFSAIATSSLSIRKKHLSKWMSRLQCCHFLYMGLFYIIFLLFCDCIGALFVMTVMQHIPA